MKYRVDCGCGKEIAVGAGQAGSTVACACGRTVEVPSLRELRVAAGQPATRTPELILQVLLAEGRLPRESDCVGCRRETDGVVWVIAECERPEVQSDAAAGWGWTAVALMLFGLFAAIFVRALASRVSDTADEVGRDVTLRLPLRCCPACEPSLQGERLWDAALSVADYGPLLRKYPHTRLRRSDADQDLARVLSGQ